MHIHVFLIDIKCFLILIFVINALYVGETLYVATAEDVDTVGNITYSIIGSNLILYHIVRIPLISHLI
jgi:hypothetical protein